MSPLTAYLIIAALLGLAIAGFTLRRLRPTKYPPRLGCASVACLALGLFGILSRGLVMIWDGGYSRAEFQITFQDPDRQPVESVELRVEDRQGHTFYHYPVTDFLPDRVPVSDSNGLMVFHHDRDGIEFSGKCWLLFGLLPVEERPGPFYVCRFLHRGQEVYRVSYGELASWRQGTWDEVEKAKRRWKRPDWPASEVLPSEKDSDGIYSDRIVKFFDLDGDGRLNPEEGAAFCAGTHWKNLEAAIARQKGEDPEEEMEFPLVRRTLTIRVKSE